MLEEKSLNTYNYFISKKMLSVVSPIAEESHSRDYLREYKIFCVNEKIHTKKEVPSVE